MLPCAKEWAIACANFVCAKIEKSSAQTLRTRRESRTPRTPQVLSGCPPLPPGLRPSPDADAQTLRTQESKNGVRKLCAHGNQKMGAQTLRTRESKNQARKLCARGGTGHQGLPQALPGLLIRLSRPATSDADAQTLRTQRSENRLRKLCARGGVGRRGHSLASPSTSPRTRMRGLCAREEVEHESRFQAPASLFQAHRPEPDAQTLRTQKLLEMGCANSAHGERNGVSRMLPGLSWPLSAPPGPGTGAQTLRTQKPKNGCANFAHGKGGGASRTLSGLSRLPSTCRHSRIQVRHFRRGCANFAHAETRRRDAQSLRGTSEPPLHPLSGCLRRTIRFHLTEPM